MPEGLNIRIRERITQTGRRESLLFGPSRAGRKNSVRVAVLLVVTALLTWYAKHGAVSSLASTITVTVSGDADGYTVSCLTGKTQTPVSELRIRKIRADIDTAESGDERSANDAETDSGNPAGTTGFIEERTRMVDESGGFKDVFPFADSVRATLMTFGGIGILVCDSAIFAPSANGVSPQLRETLELLVIPSSSEDDILRIRDIFRPRLTAVIPPCEAAPVANVICAETDPNGGFRYDFVMRSGKLRLVE